MSGQKLDIKWDGTVTQSSQQLSIQDSTGVPHSINLAWTGVVSNPPPHLVGDDTTQDFQFAVASVDGVEVDLRTYPRFGVITRPTSQTRIVEFKFYSRGSRVDYEDLRKSCMQESPCPDPSYDDMVEPQKSDSFDLVAELESLSLLEAQAEELRGLIIDKKQVISDNLKHHREKLCLKHLIKECDGVLCVAKVLTQRICDKVGIKTQPVLGYAKMKPPHVQHMAAFKEESGLHGNTSDAANLPLMLTKSGSAHATFKPIDLVKPTNPAVRVLEALAALLGISLLFRFIRRKCMSIRKRVERAADLEERRNERAYRKAARRALMRKRWDGFVNAVNCFQQEEHRIEDYEEKRALILQDAFLEQDLDQAEKGEIMEAEIRELRNAHEIVSSLVRVDENRYNMVTPVNDPPPPLVPLPYTPLTRSRASTTYTLPSYTSESLPDYSSTPDETRSPSSVTDGITSSSSDQEESRYTPTSPTSEGSGRSRFTPTSSILETSPRASEETLRTRQSRDTRRS